MARPGPGTPPATPGIAKAALGLAISSLCLAFLTGIPAIIMGIVALGRIRQLPGEPGKGLAIAAIVVGAVGCVVGTTVVLAAVVFVLVANLAAADAGDMDGAWQVDADGEGGTFTVTSWFPAATSEGAPEEPVTWGELRVRLGRGVTGTCTLPEAGDVVGPGDVVDCRQTSLGDGDRLSIVHEGGGLVFSRTL